MKSICCFLVLFFLSTYVSLAQKDIRSCEECLSYVGIIDSRINSISGKTINIYRYKNLCTETIRIQFNTIPGGNVSRPISAGEFEDLPYEGGDKGLDITNIDCGSLFLSAPTQGEQAHSANQSISPSSKKTVSYREANDHLQSYQTQNQAKYNSWTEEQDLHNKQFTQDFNRRIQQVNQMRQEKQSMVDESARNIANVINQIADQKRREYEQRKHAQLTQEFNNVFSKALTPYIDRLEQTKNWENRLKDWYSNYGLYLDLSVQSTVNKDLTKLRSEVNDIYSDIQNLFKARDQSLEKGLFAEDMDVAVRSMKGAASLAAEDLYFGSSLGDFTSAKYDLKELVLKSDTPTNRLLVCDYFKIAFDNSLGNKNEQSAYDYAKYILELIPDYPGGMKSLVNKVDGERADQKAYENATEDNTLDGYLNYLKKFPDGKFRTAAIAQLDKYPSQPLIDPRDGNTYQTKRMNGIVWMIENLRYISENSFCYNDDEGNCALYGRIYNRASSITACPDGWRLPTPIEALEAIEKSVSHKIKHQSEDYYWNSDKNIADKLTREGLKLQLGGSFYFNISPTAMRSAVLSEDSWNFWMSQGGKRKDVGIGKEVYYWSSTSSYGIYRKGYTYIFTKPMEGGYYCRCVSEGY